MSGSPAALMLVVLTASIASPSSAQPTIEMLADGKHLWMQGDFAGAYEVLKRYRDLPFGRSFEVDFMLGTCACRMPERRERGAAFLEWVRYTYSDRLTDEGKGVVNGELETCRKDAPLSPAPAALPSARQMVTAGASLQGKIFYWINREQDERAAIGNYLTNAVPIAEERIRERWIAIGDKANALKLAQQALPASKVKIFSRFVIASQAGHTEAELDAANGLLERYLAFFVQSYGMRAPTNYMFVYLVPSIDRLRTFASRYHGMSLSFGTIAYSFRDDLSIAAVVPERVYGSLFHELFHLVARSNFGDIPTWLDEGIAALYEESQAVGGEFRGTPNWRGEVLKHYKGDIPSLRALIEQRDPALADANDRSVVHSEYDGMMLAKRQAIFSATARHFAMYLQERRALFATYTAVRDFSTSNDFTGTAEGVIRLVERSSNQGIDALDADFQAWLARQLR